MHCQSRAVARMVVYSLSDRVAMITSDVPKGRACVTCRQVILTGHDCRIHPFKTDH